MSREGWGQVPLAIAALAEWLRSGVQPQGTVLDGGFRTHVGGGISVAVEARAARPSLGRWANGREDDRRSGWANVGIAPLPGHPEGDPLPRFSDEEVAEIEGWFVAEGLEVDHHWRPGGEHGATSVSFNLRLPKRMEPSLHRAAGAYLGGCPAHGSVFCGERATWGERNANWRDDPDHQGHCTWYREGVRKAVPPVWPSVAWPEAEEQAPQQSDNDRNLEAVRQALIVVKPALEELGHHQSTVVAGRRGVIEGEPGDLSFDPIEGHGVCLPAEAALELVRLAMLARELGL